MNRFILILNPQRRTRLNSKSRLFILHNGTAEARQIVVEYIDHALPQFELYSLSIDYPILRHHGQRSVYLPNNNNRAKHTRYYYSLSIVPGESRIVYGRISFQNIAALYPDLRIWRQNQFDDFRYKRAFFLGIFFGHFARYFSRG